MIHEKKLAALRSFGLGALISLGIAVLLCLVAERDSKTQLPTQTASPTNRAVRLPPIPKAAAVIMAVESQRAMALSSVAATSTMTLAISSNIPTFFAAAEPIQKRGTLSLVWDRSTDPNVVGYRLYYGTNSRSYYASVTVSNIAKATLMGLDEGMRYYVSAVAYDGYGTESVNSNEATAVTPIYVGLSTQCWQVSSFGLLGRTNQIEVSTNLATWRTILTFVGNGNAVAVTYSNGANSWFRVEAK